MAEKKVELPEWEVCEVAVDEKRATALEEFIYEYEPGDSSSVQWRERLQRLVTTAPNTRQRAERAAWIIVQLAAKDKMQCPHQNDIAAIIAAEFER